MLGQKGKKVLILEAGPGIERSREDYLENFYLNTFKAPEAPYPPDATALAPAKTNVPRPTIPELVFNTWDAKPGRWREPEQSYLSYQQSQLPFASTYERLAGGTGNHWMGTALRMTDNDFKTLSDYGHGRDWPIGYDDLKKYYHQAENLIGVSGDAAEQQSIGPDFGDTNFPMRALPKSKLDQLVAERVNGKSLAVDTEDTTAQVTVTPAGRNSEPYQNRRVCRGNTNCTPMCPIQAKYDTQFALRLALDTGNVTLQSKAVVDYLTVDTSDLNTTGSNDEKKKITGVHYLTYDDISAPAKSGKTGENTVSADTYVLAAHAIENAKILLYSTKKNGVNIANSSDQVGRHLMDHPVYLAWGLTSEPVYGYRGPLSTSGIESFRDGGFRKQRAAWRIEIGNEGWNWPATDPYTTAQDYIYGTNTGQLNENNTVLSNAEYRDTCNEKLTRQFRVGFLVEQEADPENRVMLSETLVDHLGIPRPELRYNISDYVKAGFRSAKAASQKLHKLMDAKEYTKATTEVATHWFDPVDKSVYNYAGAGHVCGTHIMGDKPENSVVNDKQQSWDHPNLYIAGCGSMPSIGTQNPTLTMLAMCLRTVEEGILGV
ncbi:MAG: hypothetical protein COA42_14385 [Alteromonadaceae bacterium]|nr:MAG: hypothetical protein COA42_14385 [Alteromonadaceae bacterium]